MPLRSAVNMQRIRDAFGEWCEEELGAEWPVRWAKQNLPWDPPPVVVLSMVGPPSVTGVDIERIVRTPARVRFDLAGGGTGTTWTLFVNGYRLRHVQGALEDLEAVRDALRALVDAEGMPELVAGDDVVETNRLELVPESLGQLRDARLVVVDHLDLEVPSSATSTVVALEESLEVAGRRLLFLSVDVLSKHTARSPTCEDVALQLLASLREERWRLHFRRHGIGLQGVPSGPRDLGELEGTEYEGRSQFDLRASVWSRLSRPASAIERAIVTTVAPRGGDELEHTIDVTAP
jgi:hypothetical protein